MHTCTHSQCIHLPFVFICNLQPIPGAGEGVDPDPPWRARGEAGGHLERSQQGVAFRGLRILFDSFYTKIDRNKDPQ